MARRRFTPTPRRKRVWADEAGSLTGAAKATLFAFDLLATYRAAGGSTQGVTVVRTVVDLACSVDQASALGDIVTWGLVKGTQTVADAPDPFSEPFADWAYIHTSFPGEANSDLTAGSPRVPSTFDVHSMRKIDEVGDTWLLCYLASMTTPTTFTTKFRVRTLLLLP